jgi:hypothetical protein
MELKLRVLEVLAGNFSTKQLFFSEAAERPHPQNFTQNQHQHQHTAILSTFLSPPQHGQNTGDQAAQADTAGK